MKRFFESGDSPPTKFWEIWIEDATARTRFGKSGTYGRSTTKPFSSSTDAEKAQAEAIAAKLAQGFVEKASPPSASAAAGDWAGVLQRMMDDYTSVSPQEARACLVGILQNPDITWYPYGEAQALSQRIIWKFSDSGETVLWVTREGETFVSQLETEFSESSEWPWSACSDIASDFVFSSDSNGWKFEGENDVSWLIEKLARDAGHPLMILPWETIALEVSDLEVEEFIDNHVSVAEDDGDRRAEAELLFAFYSQVADMSLELPDDMEDFGYDYGDGFLPRFSRAGRFNSFLGELEESHGWGIVYDECCGTCSSSSVQDVRSAEGMEEAPVFITWAQNAEGTWGTSGWVSHMAYHPDAKEREAVLSVAESCGLVVMEGDQGGEKDGFLYLS